MIQVTSKGTQGRFTPSKGVSSNRTPLIEMLIWQNKTASGILPMIGYFFFRSPNGIHSSHTWISRALSASWRQTTFMRINLADAFIQIQIIHTIMYISQDSVVIDRFDKLEHINTYSFTIGKYLLQQLLTNIFKCWKCPYLHVTCWTGHVWL